MPTIRRAYKSRSTVAGSHVRALVSVFHNIDHMGDRVQPGAFTKSLEKWHASGDPIPVIWSHSWQDPMAHIGTVTSAKETDQGLEIEYDLDVEKNPFAKQVAILLRERRVREHSFAYDVIREHKARDGANDLYELDIIEAGPTLKGANDQTLLLDVKSAQSVFNDTRPRFVKELEPEDPPRVLANATGATLFRHLQGSHSEDPVLLDGMDEVRLDALHMTLHEGWVNHTHEMLTHGDVSKQAAAARARVGVLSFKKRIDALDVPTIPIVAPSPIRSDDELKRAVAQLARDNEARAFMTRDLTLAEFMALEDQRIREEHERFLAESARRDDERAAERAIADRADAERRTENLYDDAGGL
jgi:HK97 family phage prohead protease